MESLTLKLILTPTLIGAASLTGRRWGPTVSGWLVGLPFTSGPITFFLALNEGVAFARAAAVGTLSGAVSQAAFCLAYGWLAIHFDWPLTVLASTLVFAGATLVLQSLHLPLVVLFLAVLLVLLIVLRLMPRHPAAVSSADPPPQWDIPARMATATAFVLLLTELAPALGPYLTGLLAPFPLYATILAAFAHHLQGPSPAIGVLRGLLLGLFAFASFFLVLAALIEPVGIALAFGAATLVALMLQGGSFWVLQRVWK
ncbi:MAG: hypothetical protein ACOX1P_21300 [Thermoguttaceae bacterium]|jgi:hypothetical protein